MILPLDTHAHIEPDITPTVDPKTTQASILSIPRGTCG